MGRGRSAGRSSSRALCAVVAALLCTASLVLAIGVAPASAARIDSPEPVWSAQDLVGDVDGDGDDDIVSIERADGTVTARLSDGGAFTSVTSAVNFGRDGGFLPVGLGATLMQVDGDGVLDLASGMCTNPTDEDCEGNDWPKDRGLGWARGVGDGTFESPVFLLPPNDDLEPMLSNLLAADVTGDGIDDLVAWTHSVVQVYPGTGAGLDAPIDLNLSAFADNVVVADLDGSDGDDLVISGSSTPEGFPRLWSVLGSAVPSVVAEPIAVALSWRDLAAGDLDGDGFDDVVGIVEVYESGNQRYDMVRYGSNGDGTFTGPTTIASPADFQEFVVGDVTGDGLRDVVTVACCEPAYEVRGMPGDGTGALGAAFAVDGPLVGATRLRLGAFDGVAGLDIRVVVSDGVGQLNAVYADPTSTGAVRGVVLDALGQPIQGANVTVTPAGGGASLSATSGYSGHYLFAGIEPGTYDVTVLTPYGDLTATVVVAAGTDTVQDLQVAGAPPPPGYTVSGRVTGPADEPLGGVYVSLRPADWWLDDFSATTDAEGNYSIADVAPGTYTAEATAWGPDVLYRSAYVESVTVGTGNSVLDFELELGGRVVGRILDGNGEPIPTGGAVPAIVMCQVPLSFDEVHGTPCNNGPVHVVNDSQGNGYFGPDGAFTYSHVIPATYYIAAGDQTGGPLEVGGDTMVTIGPGETVYCELRVPGPATCGAAPPVDADADGVAAAVEGGAPNGGDGNADGHPDSDQVHVASLPSDGGSGPYVTLVAPYGTSIEAVSTLAAPDGAPVVLPFGLVEFTVTGVEPGGQVPVEVYVSDPSSINSWWKYQGGVWTDFTGNVDLSDNPIVLHLVDNGPGDDDPTAGVVRDPSGPASGPNDSVAPTVTCPTPPRVTLRHPGATLTAGVADDGSGPVSPTMTVPLDTAAVGEQTVDVTAADLAGNATTVSCAYRVEYAYTGFSSPIDNARINTVKAGKNVPVAWRVTDGAGQGVWGSTALVSLTSTTIACPALSSDGVELTLPFAIRPSHIGAGYWLGTWKSPKVAVGTCVEMRLTLDDGSSHAAVFRIVR